MLEHFNTWPDEVLKRFNSVLTPRLLSTRSSGTYTKAALLSNPEPFQAVFEQIRCDYELFQQNSKHFCANLSEKSWPVLKQGMEGVRILYLTPGLSRCVRTF